MSKKKKGITRKEALKQMGTFALGAGLSPSLLGRENEPPKSEVAAPHVRTKRQSDKPNILWITSEGTPTTLLDSYREDPWGDLRSHLVDTSNIERIAEEGLRFKNSFVTNALCAPSRATTLTGKYNHLNGMTINPPYPGSGYRMNRFGQKSADFDPSQETVAKILHDNGYKTAMIGKWHLVHGGGDKPTNPGEAGFDRFVFKRGAGGPYYEADGYLENPSTGSNKIKKKSHEGYITDILTDKAIDAMKDFDQPFFMMMQYFNVHRPFQPPHKYEDLYKNQHIPEPSTFWDDYKNRATAAKMARMRVENWNFDSDVGQPKNLTSRQRKQWNYQTLMKEFLGTYKSQNDNVGRLLDFLDDTGLADNTIVIYTSDHGFFLGEHGWLDKRFMYEQSIRVPWMIRYPDRVKAGSATDLMSVNIDNAPTVLDLADINIPDEMQGESLKPIIEGKTPEDWRDSFYYHNYEFAPPHWVLPNYGLRTDRYKLISYYTDNQWELFDLKNDPAEMDNLFKWQGYDIHPEYKDKAGELVNELKRLRKKYKDNTGEPVHLWTKGTYQ